MDTCKALAGPRNQKIGSPFQVPPIFSVARWRFAPAFQGFVRRAIGRDGRSRKTKRRLL